jgi:hypothetical protein
MESKRIQDDSIKFDIQSEGKRCQDVNIEMHNFKSNDHAI